MRAAKRFNEKNVIRDEARRSIPIVFPLIRYDAAVTADDFIAMTRRIIDKERFEEYLPTLLLPARHHIAVLEGVPGEVDRAATAWAAGTVDGGEDFFLAFKIDATHFKVIARSSA